MIKAPPILILGTMFVITQGVPSHAGTPETGPAPLAKIGNTPLTEDEMRKDLGLSLYNAENQLYQVKRNWIDQKAKSILFDQAAKEAGLARKDWDKREIESHLSETSTAEVDQMMQRMTQGQAITDPTKLAQMKQQATQYLSTQKRSQLENQLYQQLLQKNPLEVSLVKPEAPHIDVTYTKDNPVKGPSSASVTIVEFTDFQCPWCKRSQENVKAVEQTYGDKVKIVARQFPLQMHPRAFPAAEAALCAKEQGKFWEYRDKLFDKQELSDEDLKRYAKEIGLKQKKFEKCVADRKYQPLVQADVTDGQRFGVQGTPTFFVNGIQVGFQVLQDTVKAELDRKKS